MTRQEFEFHAFAVEGPSALQQTAPTPTTYVEGTDFAPTPQSEPGDVTAAGHAVDLALGAGNASTSGCEAADFAGFPAGNIALIQRGTCTFAQKGNTAAAAGRRRHHVLQPGQRPQRPGADGHPGRHPGRRLHRRHPRGQRDVRPRGASGPQTAGLTMRMFANVSRVLTTTENVIAETQGGDAEQRGDGRRPPRLRRGRTRHQRQRLRLQRAHRDRRADGQGQAQSRTRCASRGGAPRRRAWSARRSTSDQPRRGGGDDEIELYLNFDMIGSPNYGLFILDGDGGAFGTEGPARLRRHRGALRAVLRRTAARSAPPRRSTGVRTTRVHATGIPAGGLFTGAEVIKTAGAGRDGGAAPRASQFDPCYHAACDTIDNLSPHALALNADAVAYAVYLYASGREVINQH